MNFARLLQGVNNVTTFLNQMGLIQINNIVIDRNRKLVSWSNYQPGVMRNSGYPLEYQFLIDNQQYSYLLRDGSFIQLYFEFDDKDCLILGKQAFYPRPIPIRDQEDILWQAADEAADRGDDDVSKYLLNWLEMMELQPSFFPANTSHLRFDYDSKVTVHCKSHLQLGAIQEFRLPADFFPQPMAFIQLCQCMIPDIEEIDSALLGFERNHRLILERPIGLIGLGHG